MNKWQEERQAAFGEPSYSNDQQQAVLDAMHHKRKPKWIPGAVIVAIAAILLFFVMNKPPQPASYTAASLEQAYVAIYGEQKIEKIILPFATDNDALVISKYEDDLGVARVERAVWKEGKWRFTGASTGVDLQHREYQMIWSQAYDEEIVFFAGTMNGLTDTRVILGDKEVDYVKLRNGYEMWYGVGKSLATPVFYEQAGELIRKPMYEDNYAYPFEIPFLVASDVADVKTFSGDDMLRGGRTYTDYPVVIDRHAYDDGGFHSFDVVVVNVDGEEHLTRLIPVGDSEIAVQEGSITVDGGLYETPYTMGSWDDEMNAYHPETTHFGFAQPDEVFVMPDNWASDGVRGFVKKSEIVGKVLGYSKMHLQPDWSDEERALYEQYKQGYDAAVLKEASPATIVRLQRYAQYVEDYETMYALFAKPSMKKTYEDWRATTNFTETEEFKQQLLYEAFAAKQAFFEPDVDMLRWRDSSSDEILFQTEVAKEDGMWKVKFGQVKYMQ